MAQLSWWRQKLSEPRATTSQGHGRRGMRIKLDEKAFSGVFRAGDSRKLGLDLKRDRANIILKAMRGASAGYAKYGPIHTTLVKGRNCNSVKDYSQALILRILARFDARNRNSAKDSLPPVY